MQRVRTQAACFMVIASLAVGFIAGRGLRVVCPVRQRPAECCEPPSLSAGKAVTVPRAIRSGSRELSPAPSRDGPRKPNRSLARHPGAEREAKAAMPGEAPAVPGPTAADREPTKASDTAAAPIENRASPDNAPPSAPPPSVPADAGAGPPAKQVHPHQPRDGQCRTRGPIAPSGRHAIRPSRRRCRGMRAALFLVPAQRRHLPALRWWAAAPLSPATLIALLLRECLSAMHRV